MLIIQVPKERNTDMRNVFQRANRRAAKELEGFDDALEILKQRQVEVALKEQGVKEFFRKKEPWIFKAKSGEKIAMPAGLFGYHEGTLKRIILEG